MVPRGLKGDAGDSGRGFRDFRLFVLAKPPVFWVVCPKFDVMTVHWSITGGSVATLELIDEI